MSALNLFGAGINYDNIRFRHLGLEDGLTNQTVNAICQDSRGFVWFGTFNGLCVWDGNKMESFHNIEGDSTSLRYNFVRDVFNDPDRNSVWVHTEMGICRYDIDKERFSSYNVVGARNMHAKFFLNSNGDLLLGLSIGIYVYDAAADEFKPYAFTGAKNLVIRGIYEDETSVLWVATSKGLRLYDMERGVERHAPAKLSKFVKNNSSTLIPISKDEFVISTWSNDLYLYNASKGKLKHFSIHHLNKTIMRAAIKDADGNIWVGTEDGIFIFDRSLKLLSHFTSDENDLSGLNDTPIYELFMDEDKNIWVGNYFTGANCYIYGSDQFRHYQYGSTKNRLSGKAVRNIIGNPQGGLFIATEDGGINTLCEGRVITRNERNGIALNGQNIHSLYLDKNKELWVGHFLKGLVRYNPRTGRSVAIDRGEHTRCSAFAIAQSGKGDTYFAGPNGLYKVVGGVGKQTVQKITGLTIFSAYELSDSVIWLGSRNNGLHILNTNTDEISSAVQSESLAKDLYITSFGKESSGNVWVCTDNDGLKLLSPQREVIAEYGKNIFGTNSIKSVVEDDAARTWVGTDNGLFMIDRSNGIIEHYTVFDGLPTNHFNNTAAYKHTTGELFFGTIDGMVSFYPDHIHKCNAEFSPVITSISSNGARMSPNNHDAWLESSISNTEVLTLRYDQARSLEVRYSAMNFNYLDQTHYCLLMEGVDRDWRYVGDQNQVHFSNLAPGHYNLKIRAGSNERSCSKGSVYELPIRVLAPWWLSWWAVSLYIIFILSLVSLFAWFVQMRFSLMMKLNNIQEHRANIMKMNQDKINFFAYVSHDLKTPLTLVISPLNRIIEHADLPPAVLGNLKLIQRNVNKMQYLIDELLILSKIEMKQMTIIVRQGNITDYIEEMSELFDEMAEERGINFQVDVDHCATPVWFSPTKVERILSNLLSNAMKYTDCGGEVILSARVETINNMQCAVIEVKDNGRGIAPEHLDRIFDSYYQVDKHDHRIGFGLGLSLTKSLVGVHKGALTVESEVGKGSKFRVVLNVSDSAYSDVEKSNKSIDNTPSAFSSQVIQNTCEVIESVHDGEADRGGSIRYTMLVVEDNRDMNEYICDIFRKEYNVLSALNGEAALRVLEKHQVDIVISDVMMPKMDGYELVSKIKEDLTYSHIMVVLLTAKSDTKGVQQGYESGADAYIAKPFDADNLLLLVSNMMEQKQRNIDHFRRSMELKIDQVSTTPRDDSFLQRVVDVIRENMSDEEFKSPDIVKSLNVSRSLLHSKLKSLTGMSLTHFVRNIKMKEAKVLLNSGLNISQTSYKVGITDPNYFSKMFRKEFGISPSDYLKGVPIVESQCGEDDSDDED